MAGFRPLVTWILLMGLLATAMLNFGIILANNNDASQNIGNDSAIAAYASSLNESLAESYTDSRSAEDALSSSPATLTSGFITLDAVSGIWKTMKRVPVQIFNLTANLLSQKILGIQAMYIIIGIIGAILTIALLLLSYKLVTTGESER